jgi:alanine-synthesizing transaminase
VREARDYLTALELLSSLRLCSAVPAQWAVQTALGGYQSIRELVSPGGRLYESRAAIIAATQASKYLCLHPPAGAMYAFVAADTRALPDFDDQRFALELLEQQHVLIAPGVSFNVPYRTHFRITNLPQPAVLHQVFARMEELLAAYAAGAPREADRGNIVAAQSRFK